MKTRMSAPKANRSGNHGKLLHALTKVANTMQRTCASIVITVEDGQRKLGRVCIVKNFTTQRVSARIVIFQDTIVSVKSKRRDETKKPQNFVIDRVQLKMRLTFQMMIFRI